MTDELKKEIENLKRNLEARIAPSTREQYLIQQLATFRVAQRKRIQEERSQIN
jgi:hypothetical protein